MRPRPFPDPASSRTPRRVVLAIPPGELLLEVALNLLPLAEAGAITLVLQPDYCGHDPQDSGLVIRKAPAAGAGPGGRLLEVVDPANGGRPSTVRWDTVVTGELFLTPGNEDRKPRRRARPAVESCQPG